MEMTKAERRAERERTLVAKQRALPDGVITIRRGSLEPGARLVWIAPPAITIRP
jgi:hypothetical protein